MDPELYNAAIYGCNEFSEKITQLGSNIYLGQVTSQNNTILHVAAKSGQRKLAEDVLSCSSPTLLHEKNSKGNTALHVAARLGHSDTARLFVTRAKEQELEADISLTRMANKSGDTALHEAVRNGHFEVAVMLIDEDRELTCQVNGSGESPIFLGVDRGFFRVVLHMLEASPKCSYGGRNGMNALHAAVIRTHKCNQFKSSSGKYILVLWSKLSFFSLVAKRISYFSQLVCPGFKFPWPNSGLTITGVDFVGKVLQKSPSSMAEADNFGWTPLHYAAHLGNLEVVKLFLEINRSNSIVYIKDKHGMSALHIAAKEGFVAVMSSIIEKCPDACELLDSRDRTALHVAVERRKRDAAKFLLRAPAFQDLVNERDREGNTALHLAAIGGDSEVLEILAKDSRLDKGALNNSGMTVVDLVRSSTRLKDHEILKTLSMASLESRGALPSLEQKVNREASEHNWVYDKEDDYRTKMSNLTEEPEPETNSNSLDFKNSPGINLLVSTIVATVTFAAAFTMPGGYNQRGEAISSGKKSFRMFLLFDSLAFGCSVASMFVHFLATAWPNKRAFFGYPVLCVTALTEVSLVGLALAFVHGALVVVPEKSELANLATNSVLLSFLVPVLYFGVKICYNSYCLFRGFGISFKRGC